MTANPPGARWRVWLPIVASGWLATHAVTCELVAPHQHASAHEPAGSGHGSLDSAPVLLACALTLLPAVAALAFREGRRGGAQVGGPPWRLALLPAAGFTVQVHVERLLHTGAPPVAAAFEATFVAALTVQVVLGVAAVALARGVHALARALRSRLPARIRPCLTAVLTGCGSPPAERPARRSCPLLAAGHAGRAPPLAAVVP